MFDDFPKVRTPLPSRYEAIFKQHYLENRGGATPASAVAQALESWMHRMTAKDAVNSDPGATLEIGGGNLNHLSYEPRTKEYDVVEPSLFLYESAPARSRIRNFFVDLREVPTTARYQRIISIATFEHICDLPQVVARAGLLLAHDGALRVAIPNEGHRIWKWGMALTTGLEFRLRYGLDYRVINQYDHVNTAEEIDQILRYFFAEISHRTFGFGKSLSIYRVLVCRRPKVELCKALFE
jgi:hypothetical protein